MKSGSSRRRRRSSKIRRRALRRRADPRLLAASRSPRYTTPRPATTTASGCRAAISTIARRSSSIPRRPSFLPRRRRPRSGARPRRGAAAPPRPDGPESRGLSERCITFGVPRFQAAYSSVYQIVQAPNQASSTSRRFHDVRVIALDGRAHLPASIPQMLGNSRDARGRDARRGNAQVLAARNARFDQQSASRGRFTPASPTCSITTPR